MGSRPSSTSTTPTTSPSLSLARRTLRLDPKNGDVSLEDTFAFDGAALEIEEAFVTWLPVERGGCDGAHRRQALDADARHPGAGGRDLHGNQPGGPMPGQ